MKKYFALLTTSLLFLMLFTVHVYSQNPFTSEQYKTIVNYGSKGESTASRPPRIVLTIGELFTFEKGQDGYYEDYDYSFSALPATYFDIGFILGGGLTLGIGGQVHYDIFDINNQKTRTFGWAAGGSLFYYFGLRNKVIPYLGFKYFYGQESSDVEDTTSGSRLIVNNYKHSMQGTGGLLFKCTQHFGIYLGYSYVYEMIESDLTGPVKNYTGSFHRASLGFKVFL